MENRIIFVLWSPRLKKYFKTISFNMPDWTKSIQDSYQFLTKEKAQDCLSKYIKLDCDILECTAFYPEGKEPFIKLNK